MVALALVLGASAAAEAQWTGERWVRGRPHRFEGSGAGFVTGTGGDDQWAFSPALQARFRVVDDHPFDRDAFIVDLDIAARGIGVAGPFDSFRPGNPYVGLRLGWREPSWVVRGGIGTTAPITNAFDDGLSDLVAYRVGQAMYGGEEAWLLEPEIQPLVLRGDFEIHSQYVMGGFDAALGVIFPLRRAGGGDTELAFQTGAFGAFTPIPELAIGMRLALFFATDWRIGFGGVDELQLALTPFVRVDLLPAFIELRLVMNLDRPNGFAFDPGGIWALALSVGGRF